MSAFVDTETPGSYQEIEVRTPRSDHTGNIRRLIGYPTEAEQPSTTSARKSKWQRYVERLAKVRLGWAEGGDYELSDTHADGLEALWRIQYLKARGHDDVSLMGHRGVGAGHLHVHLSRRVHEQVRELLERELAPTSIQFTPNDLAELVRSTQTPVTESVPEAIGNLRDLVDLPVQDLAAMCGVRRRQFYNLLDGTSQPSSQQERWFRSLRQKVSHLSDLLDGSPQTVRGAILSPVAGGRSFFDAAAAQDGDQLESVFEQLVESIEGGVDLGSPLPPSGRLPDGDPLWERSSQLLGAKGLEPLPGRD